LFGSKDLQKVRKIAWVERNVGVNISNKLVVKTLQYGKSSVNCMNLCGKVSRMIFIDSVEFDKS